MRCRSHQHRQESKELPFYTLAFPSKCCCHIFVGVLQFCSWMELGQEPSLVLGSSTALDFFVHLLCECDPWSSCVHLGCHIAHKYCAKSLILLISRVLKFPGTTCWWVMDSVWLSMFTHLRRWFSPVKHLGNAWDLKSSQKPVWFQVLLLAIMSELRFLPHSDLVVLLLEQRNSSCIWRGSRRVWATASERGKNGSKETADRTSNSNFFPEVKMWHWGTEFRTSRTLFRQLTDRGQD